MVGLSVISTDRLGSVGKYYPYGQRSLATTNGTEKFALFSRLRDWIRLCRPAVSQSWDRKILTPDSYKAKTGGAADPKNPTSWNRYGYTLDDPINRVDPTDAVPTRSVAALTANTGLSSTTRN